jgi:hypothetical protein
VRGETNLKPLTENTNMEKTIKIGDSVIVNGTLVLVDEINLGIQYWGKDDDGEDMGFTSEQVTAIVPQ